ncbi:tyrosine-type recombinase/integrase [Corynebacterium pseudodiphtheriticum]|uniref:tyrosine-type recombinase/integrase n=1 Tax=Corynebacterium pseudodiphtheriticum TaxID=37637 RepID=UPI003B63DA24
MARGRKPTPLGTWGNITVKQTPNGKYQASTYLRLHNGTRKRVRGQGTSKTAATNQCRNNCQQLLTTQDTTTLTTTTTITELAEYWFTQKATTEIRPQTLDRYRNAINNHITPHLGQIRLNEIKASYINHWIHSLTPGVVGNVRSVLKPAFTMALRDGLITTNPMDSLERLQGNKKEVRTLSTTDITEFRAAIAKSNSPTLIGVVDLCLATGLRVGEVLALNWQDLHLDEQAPWLEVTGTIVNSKAGKNQRQTFGKTAAANRKIPLNSFALKALKTVPVPTVSPPPTAYSGPTGPTDDKQAKHTGLTGGPTDGPTDGPTVDDISLARSVLELQNNHTTPVEEFAFALKVAPMVFPSRSGTYMSVSNFQRLLRKWRTERFKWVTVHTFRKTFATRLTERLGAEKAAVILGHVDDRLTQNVYVEKDGRAVDLSGINDFLE